MRGRTTVIVVVALLALAGPLPAGEGVRCPLTKQPAATLLLPYFEVDVEDPQGRDTLFSVGNANTEPALVHAVLRTHWGLPALSFDFFLPADGLRSFSVRDLVHGRLPETSPPPGLPGGTPPNCTDPLTLPEVSPETLLAVLTGRPDPADGLCRSSAVEDGRLATGYVTVDVVRDCSGAELRTPLDEGYFSEGGSGLASNDNVLWGEFFLVDPGNDYAQGERLVSLIADVSRYGGEIVCVTEPCPQRIPTTFYDRPEGNRIPLARTYRSRYLAGGGFSGTTELVLWREGRSGPAECGSDPLADPTTFAVHAVFRNQKGELTATHAFSGREHSLRVRLGDERLPVAAGFGSVDLSATRTDSETSNGQQLWVMPLLGAEGRYSAGMEAVPIEDFCPEPGELAYTKIRR